MIGLLNSRSDLKAALSDALKGQICELDTYIDPHPVISGLFIDWLPKTDDPKFGLQSLYVEHYAKAGVPIVVFDRHLALTNTEYSWLKKFNISFMEPVLNYRNGFQWMPLWVEVPFKFNRDHLERKCFLFYNGNISDRVMAFDKYYKKVPALLPSKEICYASNDVSDFKVEELKNVGIHRSDVGYHTAAATILIGTTQDYIFGRLPDNLFEIMRLGCVPLLPIEHRFYCSAWDEMVISNTKDLQFLLQMSSNVGTVLIADIMENLLARYPEFDITFTVDRIKSLLL